MLTPRQQDLVKRFCVGITLLDGEGERQNTDLAKRVLHNCVATDLILNESKDIPNWEPSILERQHFIFRQLSAYCAYEKLSMRLSYVIAICVFAFAVYQFFESGWIWGIGTLVLVPIGALVSNLIFLATFTRGFSPSGFSPLLLGLTHTECRFACNEIVGHSRWNE